MPSKPKTTEPTTSLLFKAGDRVKLKTHILMPNVGRGEAGIVDTIETDDIYPVNVLFDNHPAYGPVPCWDTELVAESPAPNESAD